MAVWRNSASGKGVSNSLVARGVRAEPGALSGWADDGVSTGEPQVSQNRATEVRLDPQRGQARAKGEPQELQYRADSELSELQRAQSTSLEVYRIGQGGWLL